MKKTIFAFLIVAIVIATVVLLLVKYPKPETGLVDPQSQVVTPSDESNTVPNAPEVPLGKLPAGTEPASSVDSLIGTTWAWGKTIMSDGTIITPKKSGVFAIAFGANGRLLGKTDCNGFFGTYQIGSDGVITFGPLASTLMYCEGSQETDFSKPFADVVRYTSDTDGNLALLLKDNSGAIMFTKK